ncbi:TIGR03943 family putative permease subunit [Saccharopolyspora sp. 5N708]|uniref:TIGR03943 family putative permease subunit n=1 Tax=Saccharopolyspora sp. 5N708 TaxID=3457424 RepID=UPI003FD5B68B
MRRETQNLLLLLLGGALLKIALGGSYLRYVKPSLFPWLVAAGVIMIGLAAFAIVSDIRSGGVGNHEHGSRSPWMLLLPVFAIFLIAPPALGADSVTRDRVAAPPPKESLFPDLPPEQAPLLSLSEFVTRVIWDDSGALNGRAVRLQGFVVHPTPGSTQLARMRISCCAADAAPVKVDLAAAAQAAELPADTWIEVTGKLRPGTATEANDYVPTLDALLIRPIPAPQDTYEY